MSQINFNRKLYKYKFSHLDFYSEGNIFDKLSLASVYDRITHTHRITQLCKLRDHVNTCNIVSVNRIHVLPSNCNEVLFTLFI